MTQLISVDDILKLDSPAARRTDRLRRRSALQFGELRLPNGEQDRIPSSSSSTADAGAPSTTSGTSAPSPPRSRSGASRRGRSSTARVGNDGGGWPGTFQDVARATDHLRTLAPEYRLDLERAVAVGHSAGGHLVLWLAGRRATTRRVPLPEPDPLFACDGVVSLAGVERPEACVSRKAFAATWQAQLLGGSPDDVPERYRARLAHRATPHRTRPSTSSMARSTRSCRRHSAETYEARGTELW